MCGVCKPLHLGALLLAERAEEPPPSAPRREQGLDPSADPGSRQDYRREGKLFDGGKLGQSRVFTHHGRFKWLRTGEKGFRIRLLSVFIVLTIRPCSIQGRNLGDYGH